MICRQHTHEKKTAAHTHTQTHSGNLSRSPLTTLKNLNLIWGNTITKTDPDTELAPWFSSGVDTEMVLADLTNDGVPGNFAVHDGIEPGSYSLRLVNNCYISHLFRFFFWVAASTFDGVANLTLSGFIANGTSLVL